MSWQNRVVCGFFRVAMRPAFTTAEKGEQMLAHAQGPGTPPRRLLRRHPVTSRRVAGHDVHTVEPAAGIRSDAIVLYLHGGSYINQVIKQHWDLIADIADATGCAVEVPIYPLAPSATLPQMLDFLLEVVDTLPATKIRVAGDSAGGGLALLLAQRLRDRGTSPVESVVVMAPWLDLAMDNPGIDAVEAIDPWLARPAMRPIAAAVAGDVPVDDPRVSPVRGDLAGLPPITVHVGTRDITLPDCRLLVERVHAAGGAAELVESPGSPHVHPMLPTPEGRAARASLLSTLAAGAR
ncbi:alpha/beta hydrolase fold domain-containing protein [Nocardioides sp. AE5]|uniref:alpha/beta hydrolase fold domain-containing protein n=1 Tax=Nocardioides sp. AE5 TaxID=2962573 RepID=UPI002881E6C7|nr:alpha/beta hydrolase fold domain-containing protein [Nocardioides sp. AE5]MDT0201071.1 alpha/beta hydrolase fold domain-containing protein [Nocardioides sp. AE5]